MIVYGNIPSTAKRVKKSSLQSLKDKNKKEVYKPKPIYAPRGNHTLI